jgi:hypothetical protein
LLASASIVRVVRVCLEPPQSPAHLLPLVGAILVQCRIVVITKEGQMRSRILLGSLLLLGVLAVGTIATSGDGVAPPRQWALTNFVDPVLVADQILMGPYLIVHDDARMARGEPCTSFYRFDPVKGRQEEVLSFHCTPATRKVAAAFTITKSEPIAMVSLRRVTEYQFAGDCEGHRIPIRP